ncbi:NAD(P)-dependent oxidoreductase [Acuticoccus mangrovi]|uniref:2-hydroxyacid dehydrogenase n=1 Tax=Acuticoccus mangrovi TaxID=2796142 RepID=A0A934IGI7_9HYPH|nr:NAD(P)-dependent oxidoreductase [Acuticoccus mangrovi]MBJ3774571.1 2-hydroxyacid dehydrogenase [Acuticoccus mangrovi]
MTLSPPLDLGAPERSLDVPTLVVAPLVDAAYAYVERGCRAIDHRSGRDGLAALDAATRAEVEAVITSGIVGFSAADMDLFPRLKVVASFSVGHENIDLEAAAERGIPVTNAPATNGETVADHTIMLMLAAARALPEMDAAVRAGRWMDARKRYRPTLSGANVGIAGLGAIGGAIASRAAAFGTTIRYTGRTARAESPYDFVPDLLSLAEVSDFLVMAVPGGPATRHMVSAAVLDALGPSGVLVNIGRGSVVDSAALAVALGEGRIAAAGLDVVDGEPEVPDVLLGAPNLVMTPHMAGRSPMGLRLQCERALGSIAAATEGTPLTYRVG